MDNLWTRRANSNKLSVITNPAGGGAGATAEPSSRNASSKRGGREPAPNGKPNAASSTVAAAPSTNSIASPLTGGGASSAFGLGSGAFASFGSAKTPKTPGNPFDSAMGSAVAKAGGSSSSKDAPKTVGKPPGMAPISETNALGQQSRFDPSALSHPLKDAWSFWYRPPISKAHGYIEYENTLHGIATMHTAEEFWEVYAHLKRPSELPIVSDYHMFKKDIRPIWEDDVNRKGGKWIVRMKKGVADRYWEDLLLSLIGDQFGEVREEVCGAVLSMRNGEDILSIWTRTDDGRVLRIREIMKHVLSFPPNTRVEFKSHDSSIQQKTAIEEQRREKAGQQTQQQHHHHHHHHHHQHHQHEKRYGATASKAVGE